MELQLRLANEEHAPLIWEMQKAAFQRLLNAYQDYDTNPANEPIEKVTVRLRQKERFYYLILADGQAVGAVSVIDRKDGSRKRIAPIFLLPQFQGLGYAKKAMLAAERLHGKDNWELDTILQEENLCRFYEKLGYRQTGASSRINDKMTLVAYRKG